MKADHLLREEKMPYARVGPPCPVFGACGGCSLQDLAYEDQLALKRQRLIRAFASLDGMPAWELIGLEEPWRYRNKAEFTFGSANGALTLGYHMARSYWRIVDLEDCLLMPEAAMRAARRVLALAAETGLPAYHPRTHQGFFRYLLVRVSRSTGRLLLCLMTAPGPRETIERIAGQLQAQEPAVASCYWGVTARLADIAVPETLTRLWGEELLEEQVGPFTVRLHPLSFLQPSLVQAERMYGRLREAVEGFSAGVGWDLYCGIGLAGFYLAGRMRKVYGVDSEPHHLALAAANAARNSVSNIEFKIGKVESLLMDRRFWLQEAKPDVVVVDPPRAGLHPQALSSLLAARPRRVISFSCNVQSLVRDLAVLLKSFPRYRLISAQAYDMFPQTNHVETLVVLERQG
jgi:23S rRNA (uracil1939-C5)-methyltransferase